MSLATSTRKEHEPARRDYQDTPMRDDAVDPQRAARCLPQCWRPFLSRAHKRREEGEEQCGGSAASVPEAGHEGIDAKRTVRQD